ncbi:MAG: transcription elongation factor GreA [Oscillospiraceae bacterium]|nr:transcription elongation factor GreA [Oscillospiraceae bacterium]
MSKEALMSKAKLKEYEQELEYLKTVKRKEIAEVIKEARSHGDLSENSEYDEAKNNQAMVESRIVEIEKMLQNAKVLDEDELSTDKVSVGSVVRVEYLYEGEAEEYSIVSSGESDAANNKISDESPVGSALIGHRAGETVEALTPGGVTRLKIKKIGKQNLS